MVSRKTTYRALNGEKRIATAVPWKGEVLQVFPEKKMFNSLDKWYKAWPSATFQEIVEEKKSRQVKNNYLNARLKRELLEFFDISYKEYFKNVVINRDPTPTVNVTMQDNTVWTVERSLSFLTEPPRLFRNGEEIKEKYEWYPSLTSVKWLLMVAINTE